MGKELTLMTYEAHLHPRKASDPGCIELMQKLNTMNERMGWGVSGVGWCSDCSQGVKQTGARSALVFGGITGILWQWVRWGWSVQASQVWFVASSRMGFSWAEERTRSREVCFISATHVSGLESKCVLGGEHVAEEVRRDKGILFVLFF